MAFSTGFQLSLELSRVFPIPQVVSHAASQILEYARDLRKSGSDIVVEADLNEVFGRAKITREIEEKFRSVVKIQKFTSLHEGSEVRLDSGPSPTLINALQKQNNQHFATDVQLSLLGWTHNRDNLALNLAESMTKRFNMGVKGASADPGVHAIAGTLTACSSQTSAFAWSDYTNLVDGELEDAIAGYRHSPNLLALTPGLLLGAMDYLCLVQQLPEDRYISVSGSEGAITLIIWAHYVLGLNVTVTVDGIRVITFGDENHIHLGIVWRQGVGPASHHEEPRIRLLDRSLSVILEVPPEPQRWHQITSEDRQLLSHAGLIYLYRLFNEYQITDDNDPIYHEIAKLVTAVAIYASQRLDRFMDIPLCDAGILTDSPRRPIAIELWRVRKASEVIFSGLPVLDMAGVQSYLKFLSEGPLDEGSLPNACTRFLRNRPSKSEHFSLLSKVCQLAAMVLIFSHVENIENCAEMPIIMNYRTLTGLRAEIQRICREDGRIEMNPDTIYKSIITQMASSQRPPSDISSRQRQNPIQGWRHFLFSEFGWSVQLHSVSDKDPAYIRPELVRIRKGVPVNSRTGARTSLLQCGSGLLGWNPYPDQSPVVRGREYRPKAAASLVEKSEYWTTGAESFSHVFHYNFNTCPDWRIHILKKTQSFTECQSYWNMHVGIWTTYSTTECTHQPKNSPTPIKLGPDAAAVLGWRNEKEVHERLPEPVLIYLTRGVPEARWSAISQAVNIGRDPNKPKHLRREVMLRTEERCEKCALEQTIAMGTRFILIL